MCDCIVCKGKTAIPKRKFVYQITCSNGVFAGDHEDTSFGNALHKFLMDRPLGIGNVLSVTISEVFDA